MRLQGERNILMSRFSEVARAAIYSRGTWRDPGNGCRCRAPIHRRFLPQNLRHAEQEPSLGRAHRLLAPLKRDGRQWR